MEVTYIDFESPLILTINNQIVKIVLYASKEISSVQFGIDAPRTISVHREERYSSKKEQPKLEQKSTLRIDPTKIPTIFTELLTVTHKSEKLEVAAKNLFQKQRILTPKTLAKIASGELPTTKWAVTSAIDVLLAEKPQSIKRLLTDEEFFVFWARPLLKNAIDTPTLLNKAQCLDSPVLIDKITNYSMSSQ